ncbi:MAG: serine/threonine-protein kinase [Gordonia sp. (in: high G+C Gram-positive bacteria)]
MLSAGDEFAGFTIERVLGAGGMGTVYLAQHPRLPRKVALKVLADAASSDPAFRARFEREAAVVAQLEQPNIVGIYDTGEDDGRLWLSMPFVDGPNAAELMAQRGGRLDPAEAVGIGRSVAAALDYAHSRGLVHRDVKPANILLSQGDGKVLLADFGIAHEAGAASDLTATGTTVGTVDYISPEQLTGKELTGASDVYSLAAVLYTMLTGTPPFSGDTAAEKMGAHLHVPPPHASTVRPDLPPQVDAVLARGLSKQPATRQRSATELVDELDAALRGVAQFHQQQFASAPPQQYGPGSGQFAGPAPQPSVVPPSSTSQPSGKGKWIALAVVAAVVVLAGLGVGGYFLVRGSDAVVADHCDSVEQAAGEGVASVFTYDYRHVDDDMSQAKSHLTGQALKQVEDNSDAQIRIIAKAKSTGRAEVTQTTVDKCSGDDALVLTMTKVTMTTDGTTTNAQTLAVWATMKYVDGKWLIAEIADDRPSSTVTPSK